MSGEIEERLKKKLSQAFIRIEYRFVGALLKVDEFLPNSQVRVQSGTVPGTSQISDRDTKNRIWTVLRVIPILKWVLPSIAPPPQFMNLDPDDVPHTIS